MDHVAGWSASQRRDLFLDTAERHGEVQLPGLIEKDFWVCWCLNRLFRDDRPPRLLFKGGTSLSKVYGVIERLSEDIDLSIDRAWFGFSEERDPANARSNKHARRLLSELREVCATYVTGELLQRLADDFGAVLGERGADATGWSLMPDPRDRDHQTLLFRYPSTEVTLATDAYVAPDIRLELGARSDHWPVSSGEVRPYAAEAFREEFEQPSCTVRVLGIERTFWEKATILHAVHYGGAEHVRARMARHYYDLACLASTNARPRALAQPDMLISVARHKMRFFPNAWARYDEARPGTLRLLPPEDVEAEIRRDYARMRPLFLRDPPGMNELLETLRDLEREIND